MITLGLLIPSISEFGSPLLVVPKANITELRLVGDYKVLNKMLLPTVTPCHISAQLMNCCMVATYFPLLNLNQLFTTYQLHRKMSQTTTRTPVGAYTYTRTPFGLSTSAQVFQRLIDTVIRGLPFVYAYVDDILIFSKDEKEHLEHLSILFQRLNNFGLTINLKKCRFGKNEIRFLGHVITPKRISPATDRIEAVRNFSLPKTDKALRRFIRMLQFYSPFIPRLSHTLAPLYDMIKGKRYSHSTIK